MRTSTAASRTSSGVSSSFPATSSTICAVDAALPEDYIQCDRRYLAFCISLLRTFVVILRVILKISNLSVVYRMFAKNKNNQF